MSQTVVQAAALIMQFTDEAFRVAHLLGQAPDILAKLNSEINAGLNDPKLKARYDLFINGEFTAAIGTSKS